RERSQAGWHESTDNPLPFIKYMRVTIIAAYRDFNDRMNLVGKSSFDTVYNAVISEIGKFTKRDIVELCPSLSAATVERNLKKLCADGIITKSGGGRSTFYIKNN
ncbi:MAG: Fic family protein, partial [Oscillospiraceae bacterium]|nr:Fic family protein [Oscillospiraceae bacterium]